ncbi:MAG: hypothetical protein OHK0039_04130 [Bacteroidia bacterium]
MHIPSQFVAASEAFVRQLLTDKLSPDYAYHTLGHTVQVVGAVDEIGSHTGLSEDELNLVKIAAWFHDTGYTRYYIGHEQAGMEIASHFLTKQGAEPELIRRVEELIEVTRVELEPRNVLEKVIKDADLYNLSLPDALQNSEAIRHEWQVFCDRTFSDEEWDEFNYQFFKTYEYYTPYGRDHLAPRKQENVRLLKKRVKKNRQLARPADEPTLLAELDKRESEIDDLKRKLKKAKKAEKDSPSRGIETMFRTTYRTHISLSDLADNKANILLSINAIVISIVFSNAIGNFDAFRYLIFPSILLMLVSMTTIVFAILATRPKINSGIFTREDILEKRTNLLFFGNFYRMELDDYMWGIGQMMQDAEYLYGSMTKDIYFLGRVLARKFWLLRVAYNVFMYGTGIAILAFVVTFALMGFHL